MPPKENLERACEECIHYWACSRQCGEPMAQRSATGCECYETVKSIAAARLIERLTAENAALREKVPQWISVEDRLPIDRLSKYLVAFRDAGGSIVDMARYFPSDGWTCNNWEAPQNLITHWMPLPGAPEKGDKA
jgi:hypothetical protein|nr:MAG TPA: Protein of unknown function (DUF551) [Caudoviricetes sp.]